MAAPLAAALVALALTGCTTAATPAATTPPARKPVAAIVGVRETFAKRPTAGGWTPFPRATVWRVPLSAEATPEKLPIEALADCPPRLSPDGRRLAYVPYHETYVDCPDVVHVLDLASGAETEASRLSGRMGSLGWSAQGDLVSVIGPRAFALKDDAPASPIWVTRGGKSRSLPGTAFPGVESVSFVAADEKAVYLRGYSGFMSVNGHEGSLWSVPATGAPMRLAETSMSSHNTSGEDLLAWDVLPSRPGTPVAAVGGYRTLWGKVGADGGRQVTRGLTHVVLFSLPSMRALRSITVTPPPGVRDDRRPVFDDSLERYLVTTWRDRAADLWECDVLGGRSRTLVKGEQGKPGPLPLGYAGDDVLYRSIEDSRVVVRVYERASGASRALGEVGREDRIDSAYAPQTTLLGFAYER